MKFKLNITGGFVTAIQPVFLTETHYMGANQSIPVAIASQDKFVDTFEEANKIYQADLKERKESSTSKR